MKIKTMKLKDFNSMYSLWKKVKGLSVGNLKDEKKEVSQIIKLSPLSNFVVVDSGKIIGTVLAIFNGRRGWVYHLAVHPDYQNRGLGSLLLRKAEKVLKKAGAKRVLLGVKESNSKALSFYKKYGYKKIQRTIFLGKDLLI